ncbi:MAG: helix-turn-helix transcriptional regulator [Verrucomicrobia bacterium]|nr:helix-turn-helix transcriptional regulator [Verrucomicrobiota bacterium]MCH8528095.1 AraC family transcriptional regulator [Kiritimatiellia bacterium]
MRTSLPHPPLNLYACQARLVWANERTVEPVHLRPKTGEEPIQIAWYLLNGQLTLHDRSTRRTVSPGHWIFPSAQLETQEFSPESRILSLRYQLHHRLGGALIAHKHAHVFCDTECPDLETAARALIRLLQPWRSSQTLLIGRERIPLPENFAIESAFYAWLAGAVALLLNAGEPLHVPGEKDPRIARAVDEILTHPMQTPFSEARLARHCGIAVSHLNRLYKAARGKTPYQEYEERRLYLARHALRESALPMKEIAYELGFSSPAHFSNWVRSKTGTSPRALRHAVGPPNTV